MYRVASAPEYLVLTGVGIDDIKIAKKNMDSSRPNGQSCTVFDISPVNYTFEVQAMSAEKLPLVLPAVFTIGPRIDDEASLFNYGGRGFPASFHPFDMQNRGNVLNISIPLFIGLMHLKSLPNDIFNLLFCLRQQVFEKVQLELNQFGLLIYNANVKHLVDVPRHEYFSYLVQKTQMEVANQARVDVAEARMKGKIISKSREAQTLLNAARINAETKIISTQRIGERKKEEIKVRTCVKIFENLREAEVVEANADLAKKKADWAKEAEVAEGKKRL